MHCSPELQDAVSSTLCLRHAVPALLAACEKRNEFEKGMELLTAMHAAGHTAAPSNYAWFISQVSPYHGCVPTVDIGCGSLIQLPGGAAGEEARL